MSEPEGCPVCGSTNFYLTGYLIGTTKRKWECRDCENEWETEHNRTVGELKAWLEQFPDTLVVVVYEGEVSCITLLDDTKSFSFYTHERAPGHLAYPRVWKDPQDDVYG